MKKKFKNSDEAVEEVVKTVNKIIRPMTRRMESTEQGQGEVETCRKGKKNS